MNLNDEKLLSIWEWVENIGFGAVIAGCILEGVRNFPQKLAALIGDLWMHRAEKFGWILLILGLAMEFFGGWKANSLKDSKIAQLSDVASKRALEAEKLEAANLALKMNVLELQRAVHELAKSYDQTTNALAEANARLKHIRPLKDRLIECLNEMNPKIVPDFRNGGRNFKVEAQSHLVDKFRNLSLEPEGKEYILNVVASTFVIGTTLEGKTDAYQTVEFSLTKKLLE